LQSDNPTGDFKTRDEVCTCDTFTFANKTHYPTYISEKNSKL